MTQRGWPLPRLSPMRRGIAWMLVSVLLAASMDATSKYLAQFYPVLQIVWARYVFQAVPLTLALAPRLPQLVQTHHLGMQLVRSTLLLLATATFISAVHLLPLTEASAIMFLAPLIVTALSVPMLGERVGPKRWMAVVIGFAGAMIIIRPTGQMNAGVLFPLATALVYALYMVTTRQLSRTDSSLTTLVYTGSVGTLVMSAIVPFDWVAPDALGWTLMVALGILGTLNHGALILAFRSAPAALVSPFDYSRLIWATILGYVIFGNLPDGWTIIGAAVIVGAGLYIYRREARGATESVRAPGTG